MEILKRLTENPQLIAELRKLGLPVFFVIIGLALGYSLQPDAPASDCSTEDAEIATKNIEISHLEEERDKLRADIKSCEADSGKKVRDEVDLQESKAQGKTAEALKKQKAALTKFRCDRCKRQGLCK